MKIESITSLIFTKNINKLNNKKAAIPVTSNKIENGTNISKIYLGEDLVSFKSKNFDETVKENWFKLPANCKPDEFQIQAAKAINDNKNVIVEAPTGTGKTAIGYYTASKNMQEGKKTFYTTPLKALSNQKINEFKEKFGEENIGILTGDRRENPDAPILIMTTEVYRNMALSNIYNNDMPIMNNLGSVIFDEMHYMDDESRGPVWEESVMFTPKDVQMLALSATIGNAPSVRNWMNIAKGDNTELISVPESARHVPLEFNEIETESFIDEEKNEKKAKSKGYQYSKDNESDKINKPQLGDYRKAIKLLKREEKLPAIFFVFSKKFSHEILDYLSLEGDDLTTPEEKEEIDKIYQKHTQKNYLGETMDYKALRKGYAVHNAGILPAQKELVEELFQKKLIKAVIATETLAAGINMPAKTVIISRPYKPGTDKEKTQNHDFERILTPNEFKQMAGRAGRRGIDNIGYVYTLSTDKKTQAEFDTLKNSECNPIKSKYNPDYSFLTGYYQYNPDDRVLEEIYKKSFYVYNKDSQIRKENLQSVMDLTSKRTKVLLDRGFLTKNNGDIKVTQKGSMATVVRGYDNLSLIETIESKVLDGISPEGLASIAGMIAAPASYREEPLLFGSNLSEIFEDSEDNIYHIYEKLNIDLKKNLAVFGKNFEDFSNLYEISEFVDSIEEPATPQDELKTQLTILSEVKKELQKINGPKEGYSLEELCNALKKGITISNADLNYALEQVEQYKKKKGIKDDFDSYIKELDDYIEELEQNADTKSKKAKQRYEREKAEIVKDLNTAIIMQYLDSQLFDAISENYEYTKKHPYSQTNQKYSVLQNEYNNSVIKNELQNNIKGIIGIEKFAMSNDYEMIDEENQKNVYKSVNEFLSRALEINTTEINNDLDSEMEKYGVKSPKLIYNWALLNKMNPDSISNWKLLADEYASEIDEGTMYKKIMQTSDLLGQIKEIAQEGIKTASTDEEKRYYTSLKLTANEAKDLIIREPLHI